MGIFRRIKKFFCRKSTSRDDINLSLLAIRDELVILNNILQARVDNTSVNTLTTKENNAIIDNNTQESIYIPSPETELEADIRLEEKDTDSEALDDAMAQFKAAKSVEKNGKAVKPGGFNE